MQDEKALLAFLESLKEILSRGGGSNSRAEYFSDQDLADRWRVSPHYALAVDSRGPLPAAREAGRQHHEMAPGRGRGVGSRSRRGAGCGVIPQEPEMAARSTLPPWTPPKLPRGAKPKAKAKAKSTREGPKQEQVEG